MNDKVVKNNMETMKHIHRVRELLWTMMVELENRAKHHDDSKLESPEQEIFAEHVEELAITTFGTPEYQALLEKVKPAIDHHYAKNRHHTEHFPGGINDMTLIDLIEMLCDWKAATERNKNGNLRKSIDYNAKKYEMTDQLSGIFINTIKEVFED